MYIHELWNIQTEKRKQPSGLVQLASLQVLHTKPHFTALGWFAVDTTLLHTVRKYKIWKNLKQ